MRLIYCPLYPHIACPSLTIQPPSTASYWCHLQLEGNFAKLKNHDWNGFCLQLNIFKLSFPTLWSIQERTTIVVLPRKDYEDPFSAERKTLNGRLLAPAAAWRKHMSDTINGRNTWAVGTNSISILNIVAQKVFFSPTIDALRNMISQEELSFS